MRLNKVVFALLLALIVHGFALAQEREITGVVRDGNGMELFGVAVVVKGEQSKGVQTDMDGRYHIKVATGKTLEFSFLGMKTKTVKVGSSRTIDVTLEEEAQQIEEVEVVGYITVKKDQYVGTAATVDKDALKRKSVSNVSKAIALTSRKPLVMRPLPSLVSLMPLPPMSVPLSVEKASLTALLQATKTSSLMRRS